MAVVAPQAQEQFDPELLEILIAHMQQQGALPQQGGSRPVPAQGGVSAPMGAPQMGGPDPAASMMQSPMQMPPQQSFAQQLERNPQGAPPMGAGLSAAAPQQGGGQEAMPFAGSDLPQGSSDPAGGQKFLDLLQGTGQAVGDMVIPPSPETARQEFMGRVQSPVSENLAEFGMQALPMALPGLKALPKTTGLAAGLYGMFGSPSEAGDETTPATRLEGAMNRLTSRRAELEAQMQGLANDPNAEERARLKKQMDYEEFEADQPGRGSGWKALKRQYDALPSAPAVDPREKARLQSEIDTITGQIDGLQEEMKGARERGVLEDIDSEFEPSTVWDSVSPYVAPVAGLMAGAGGRAGLAHMLTNQAKRRGARLVEAATEADKLPRVATAGDVGQRRGVVDAAYGIMGKSSPIGQAPYNTSDRGLLGDVSGRLFGSKSPPLLQETRGQAFSRGVAPDLAVAGGGFGSMYMTERVRSAAEQARDENFKKYEETKDPVYYKRYKEAEAEEQKYANIQKFEMMVMAGYGLGRGKFQRGKTEDFADGASIAKIMKQKGAVEDFYGREAAKAARAAKAAATRARNAGNTP